MGGGGGGRGGGQIGAGGQNCGGQIGGGGHGKGGGCGAHIGGGQGAGSAMPQHPPIYMHLCENIKFVTLTGGHHYEEKYLMEIQL
uniref:Uncharacterized protein n=1 Tax=Heterorhabditis bacteriophora TaxID=37862 RepID=A0A1I7WMP2_HETBA